MALELLASLQQSDIEFVLGDAAYDNEKVRHTAEQLKSTLFLYELRIFDNID
uniref:hypothetical protein n=1 Tax=Thermaerobacillus caldiproteolyticus TaxID=247480 RepID=UPI001E4E02A0